MYDDNHEDTADEIVVNASRLFLGVNYQCISCHGGKGFLDKVNLDLVTKKRRDFWAMSAFFGQMRGSRSSISGSLHADRRRGGL